MRFLFITLEFSAGTFSGNGIYGRSQVRSLAGLGHDVMVISGAPQSFGNDQVCEGAKQLVEVALPKWGSLDASSAWQEFAGACADPHLAERVAEFAPDVVLGVDWTSFQPYNNLRQALGALLAHIPPYVFLNYRVYARLSPDSIIRELEEAATRAALITIALSRSDADYIAQHYLPGKPQASSRPHVLLPALREDMERVPLPATAEGAQHRRHLLACCVRLSPEKEPERFVALAEQLQRQGSLSRLGLTPILCGSAKGEYAEGLKARLRAAVPAAIIEEKFLGPTELADIFSATALNVHPCLYDAYGMTIVEAASQGAPSLVHAGGSVGATDLLSASQGEVVEVDMLEPVEALAAYVDELVGARSQLLADVGRAATSKARSWTETANAEQLVALLQGNLGTEPKPMDKT